jgi:hypothetical protein
MGIACAPPILRAKPIRPLFGDAVLARVVTNHVADGNGSCEDADAENGSDRYCGDEVAACHLIEFGIGE